MLRSLVQRIGRVASSTSAPTAAAAGGSQAGGHTPSASHDDHHHDTGFFQNPHPHHFTEVTEEVPDVLWGAFGTLQKPVIVKSAFAERIVGCLGKTNEDGHLLLWHTVTNKKPTVCVECGQAFLLKTVGAAGDHDHGHDHGHGHEQSGHQDSAQDSKHH